MKAVILSCKTGGGHNAAAKALCEALTQSGHDAQVLDYLVLAGERVSKTVGDSYVELVKHTPKAFGAVYDLGMAVSTRVKRSPIYYINAAMAAPLRRWLTEHPVDVILMTHLYAAETLTWMKRHGESLPVTIPVATDYTCIPFWEETECTATVIPHETLLPLFAARGMKTDTLHPLGIPVSPAYLQALPKEAAREALGLPQKAKIYLIVGGSMGAGDLGRLTSALARMTGPDCLLYVVCGSNEDKMRRLAARFRHDERVLIHGQTNAMRQLLAACDIVYTKPGGLTSTEAVAARIPLVHTEPIPGCETENRSFFLAHGLSVSGRTTVAQARAGVALLQDPTALAAMRQAQASFLHVDAAFRIVRLAERLVEQAEQKG